MWMMWVLGWMACSVAETPVVSAVVGGGPAPAFVLPSPPASSVVDVVEDGHQLFTHHWTDDDDQIRDGRRSDVRNADSCVACHSMGGVGGAGRASVAVPAGLGRPFSTIPLTRLIADPDGVAGFTALGNADSIAALLAQPLGITSRRPTPTPLRNTPALFGASSVDAIPAQAIRALAATSWPEHPEVTGRVAGAGPDELGRFGWKGQSASLADFVAGACEAELGLTVPNSGSGPVDVPSALDRVQVASMVDFVASLPPPQVPVLTDEQRRGERAFAEVGCVACHTPTVGPAVGVYADLLLHDMGERLADPEVVVGYYGADSGPLPTFDAAALAEWRTPPLWGVADSPPYLHDGRADTLTDAIVLHGGEAYRIRRAYQRLPVAQQEAIVAFLGALRTPVSVLADADECLPPSADEHGAGADVDECVSGVEIELGSG